MKKYMLISLSLLSLTACGFLGQNEEGKTAPTSQASSQESSKTSSSASQSSIKEDKESSQAAAKSEGVSYNGSYYYVTDSEGNEVLVVNKRYPLSSDYNPGENPRAKAAFLNLQAAMREQGFSISDSYSGFRDYYTQSGLYNDYVARDGQAAADRYSARPGHSEHQSGLAFDLIDGSGNLLQEPKAANWLLQHASDYGFVVRYPAGKESVTGYQHEEWHLRYVGVDAPAIATSGKTLEEYYGFSGGDYQ